MGTYVIHTMPKICIIYERKLQSPYMRVPIRKPGKYTHVRPDPHLTQSKYDELAAELESLKKKRVHAASEVKRLSELGDFSENVEYQLAKGRLRGINQRILDLEDHLKHAVIITHTAQSNTVQLGDTVTISLDGKEKTYTILGSSETDPSRGVISHHSPIGSALMGKRIGETLEISIADRRVRCTILRKEQ